MQCVRVRPIPNKDGVHLRGIEGCAGGRVGGKDRVEGGNPAHGASGPRQAPDRRQTGAFAACEMISRAASHAASWFASPLSSTGAKATVAAAS